MIRQRTLLNSVSCKGIGLHTGKKVTLTIRPAPVNTGIRFIRTDIPERPVIPVKPENIFDTNRATNISSGKYKVYTIEHLMAAFYGLGIDNAIVEIDAPEVPAMDGSANPFVFLIQNEAGIKEQSEYKRFIVIKKTFKIEEGDRLILVCPSKELKIEYTIEFDHPLLRCQSYRFVFSTASFIKEISKARTFGFLDEVERLKKMGLAKGGSLDNAIVFDKFRVINPEGMRYEDECVRHKILDFLGDLSTLGKPVIGHFIVRKSGHGLNHIMLKKLISLPSYWEEVVPEKKEDFSSEIFPVFDLSFQAY